jgi:hypothetical protein
VCSTKAPEMLALTAIFVCPPAACRCCHSRFENLDIGQAWSAYLWISGRGYTRPRRVICCVVALCYSRVDMMDCCRGYARPHRVLCSCVVVPCSSTRPDMGIHADVLGANLYYYVAAVLAVLCYAAMVRCAQGKGGFVWGISSLLEAPSSPSKVNPALFPGPYSCHTVIP